MLYIKDRVIFFYETISQFHIGYAPNNWRDLYNFLKKESFTDEQIEKIRFLYKDGKGLYDRFRGRILFPINNASGKVAGFTGRILPQFEKNGDKIQAKYVNSPETEIYHKSKILFGFDKAKKF